MAINIEAGAIAGLMGDDAKVAKFRDGTDPGEGVFQRSITRVEKNWYDHDLFPWYKGQNNEPEYLTKLLTDNPTLMGLIFTKCIILTGQGLTLFKDGQPVKKEDYPEEIYEFCEFNDLDALTFSLFMDQEMLGNFFAELRFNNGSSEVAKQVREINRISPECVRAYKPKDEHGPIIRYAIASAWDLDNGDPEKVDISAYQRREFYSADRRFAPGSSGHSAVLWHGKRSVPGFPVYAPPQWYGARWHIELQNEIPRWHIANIINQFGIRVQVSIAERYIKAMAHTINPDTKKNYTEQEIKDKVATMVRDLMTNPKNVGKSLLSAHTFDHQGRPLRDIIIETISLDIKDDAYTRLEEVINNKITSSVGVQAALASLITDKGMSSGSELTQAWNIEAAKARRTQAQVLQLINFIHRYNRWGKEYSWGFPNPSLVTKDIDKSGMLPAEPQPDPDAV